MDTRQERGLQLPNAATSPSMPPAGKCSRSPGMAATLSISKAIPPAPAQTSNCASSPVSIFTRLSASSSGRRFQMVLR